MKSALTAAALLVSFDAHAGTTIPGSEWPIWQTGLFERSAWLFTQSTAVGVTAPGTPTPTPTPVPTPTPTPSPSGTTILPGAGSFTDALGNTYTLNPAGSVIENGRELTGGDGTAMGEYYDGQDYFEDGVSHNWYLWNGSVFGSAVPAPPCAPTTPTPTPTPTPVPTPTPTGRLDCAPTGATTFTCTYTAP